MEIKTIILLLATSRITLAREIKNQVYWRQQSYDDIQKIVKTKNNERIAKNIVVMLGDGMGIETNTAMRIYKGELEDKPGHEVEMVYEKFDNLALAKTAATDEMVADSAATAVAILNGVRTRFAVLNVDDTAVRADCTTHTVQAEVEPITFQMQESGKAVGVVTTTRITHASPAATYAQTVYRSWESNHQIPWKYVGDHCRSKDIALQLTEKAKDFEVLFGGGRRYFLPNTVNDPIEVTKQGQRNDSRNLIDEWKNKGVKLNRTYVDNLKDFERINTAKSDRILGLFAYSHMKYEEDRKISKDQPSLTQMTETALNRLKRNANGFFLFVEGGRIDHAHHASKAKYAITEGLEFERAVQKVVDMVDMDDTLLIVTADHGHTFHIAGYPNIETPLFGLNEDEVSDIDGMKYTNIVYGNGPGFDHERKYDQGRQNLSDVDTTALSYIAQSAVPMKSETHAAGEVAVYAQGPWSHLIRGVHWQSYISQVMKYASCIEKFSSEPRCKKPKTTKERNGSSEQLTMSVFLLVILATTQVTIKNLEIIA